MSAESITAQYEEYQQLIEEFPRARIYDASYPKSVLFERFHIAGEEIFGACLRRTDKNPVFEFLIPKARLQ